MSDMMKERDSFLRGIPNCSIWMFIGLYTKLSYKCMHKNKHINITS